MKFTNINEIDSFGKAVEQCVGEVWLESPYGDKYNLKSRFSQYMAFGALLRNHGDELELFCQLKEDEPNFYKFFKDNPNVLEGV